MLFVHAQTLVPDTCSAPDTPTQIKISKATNKINFPLQLSIETAKISMFLALGCVCCGRVSVCACICVTSKLLLAWSRPGPAAGSSCLDRDETAR